MDININTDLIRDHQELNQDHSQDHSQGQSRDRKCTTITIGRISFNDNSQFRNTTELITVHLEERLHNF